MPDFVRRIPEGDNRERLICADCGHIAYDNLKVVIGSVVVADGSVLMCRRAIEPRRARFAAPGVPRFAAGPESLEVALFPASRIPRDAIAFPSVIWALDAWESAGSAPLGVPMGNSVHDPRGTERLTTSASGIGR
jgi:hypothetical protein